MKSITLFTFWISALSIFYHVTSTPSCVKKCVVDFALAVGGDVAGDDLLPLNGQDSLDVTIQAARNKCNSYKAFETCVSVCNDTSAKSAAVQGIRGVQFFCANKQEYELQVPCISNTKAGENCAIQIKELKNASADFTAVVSRLLEQFGPQDDSVWTEFKSKFGLLCSAINHQTSCVLPIVSEKCGNFTISLVNGVFAEALKGLQKLDPSMIPIQCSDLLNTDYSVLLSQELKKEEGASINISGKKTQEQGANPTAAAIKSSSGSKTTNPVFGYWISVTFYAYLLMLCTRQLIILQ